MHGAVKDCVQFCSGYYDDDLLGCLEGLGGDMRKRFVRQVMADRELDGDDSGVVVAQDCLFEWSEISECWYCAVQDDAGVSGDSNAKCGRHDNGKDGEVVGKVKWREYLSTGFFLYGVAVDDFE